MFSGVFPSSGQKNQIKDTRLDFLIRCGILKQKYPSFNAAIEAQENAIKVKNFKFKKLLKYKAEFLAFEQQITQNANAVAREQKEKTEAETKYELRRLKTLLLEPFSLPTMPNDHPYRGISSELSSKNNNSLSEYLIALGAIAEKKEDALPGEVDMKVRYVSSLIAYLKYRNQITERIEGMCFAKEFDDFHKALQSEEKSAAEYIAQLNKFQLAATIRENYLSEVNRYRYGANACHIFPDVADEKASENQLGILSPGNYCHRSPSSEECKNVPPVLVAPYNQLKNERLELCNAIFKLNENIDIEKEGSSIAKRLIVYQKNHDAFIELLKANPDPINAKTVTATTGAVATTSNLGIYATRASNGVGQASAQVPEATAASFFSKLW